MPGKRDSENEEEEAVASSMASAKQNFMRPEAERRRDERTFQVDREYNQTT